MGDAQLELAYYLLLLGIIQLVPYKGKGISFEGWP